MEKIKIGRTENGLVLIITQPGPLLDSPIPKITIVDLNPSEIEKLKLTLNDFGIDRRAS